ncbi:MULTISPECIES: aspartyl/asparaginyl beta-hydroxylase domain-containing protein [unclassified Polaromonas]|uniref:aspartyl/asparaginyl beta-hydroxylase domain-containing protein n=1 Tax=unclassified Polaromonas TaxID=2638319 RepID=UPI000F08AC59|nr:MULTISPECIES: aspartyl/asparaginyl beta-hydroxylase domain-containing protein [unclassified Polaromonas]AYQ26859.1 hypothetical protein DT070_01705 [Polaromonas sp. SP1]QGJ18295.1 hypothetical protein F7R28_07735 [Polaromonas sp. Pch-P]
MKKVNSSRGIFEDFLCQSLYEPELLRNVAILLDQDPYFMRGHLEVLWSTQKKGHQDLHAEVLHTALSRAAELFRGNELQLDNLAHWTLSDFESLREVLSMGLKAKELSLWRRVGIFRQLRGLSRVTRSMPPEGLGEQKYLVLQKTVNVQEIAAEVNGIAPYWWGLHTHRQEDLHEHRHTQSIVVRSRKVHDRQYQPVDGIHESEETAFSRQYPKVNALVSTLAHELGLALGRVVLVRLSAHGQVYRHYDDEEYLQERDRYHLVLSCGESNVLESGNNRFNVKPGELWFFDNKVMHRSSNPSGMPRTHIIFDGYPLSKMGTSEPSHIQAP